MHIFNNLMIPGSLAALALAMACTSSHSDAALAFTTQPASQTVYSGGTATFTVAASGNPSPSFVWQRSNDSGATWTPISGVTGSTYRFTVKPTDNGAQFLASATNASGSVNSLPATVTEVPAVYAAGIMTTSGPQGNSALPGYWLNGTWIGLTLPPSYWMTGGGYGEPPALSLVVSESDVYVAGSPGLGDNRVPGFWRNGTWTDLVSFPGANFGSATGLAVSGSDICVGGFNAQSPGYWMNGVWVGVTPPLGLGAQCGTTALALSGGDVYTAGYWTDVDSPTATAGYWRNTTWVGLTPPLSLPNCVTSAMAISGNNIYIAGEASGNTPGSTVFGYWQNGTWVGLAPAPGLAPGMINALVTAGSDVYAGGSSMSWKGQGGVETPCYWLDGTWVGLPLPAGATDGHVEAMAVSGNDVYAAGNTDAGPGYWLNGTWTSFAGTGGGVVHALVVIP